MTAVETATVRLSDLVDLDQLATAIDDGYVRCRVHPDDSDLQILNYTEKAQYERVWTDVTRQCRGLIVRDDVVIARPWAKFFNYGEHPDGALDLTAPVSVSDKLDGSLGILYEGPDGWAVATRGSFASEQALHATALLRERYLPGRDWHPWSGTTYLFEIVYPANRIVVDYGDRDDLVLLGTVDVRTGEASGAVIVREWPGSRAETFHAFTLAAALALPPRPNAEGVVVKFHDGLMVKIKQDDYVRLHRLVTGLNERTVWEHLAAHGGDESELLAQIPEEFWGWVENVAGALREQHDRIAAAADRAHDDLVARTDGTRKDYAIAVRRDYADVAPYCFQLLDGRDPSPSIWKAIRPVGSNPMLRTSEDVA